MELLLDQSARLRLIAQKYGFKNFELASTFFENWANVQKGKSGVKAIEKMQRMMDAYHATGTVLNRTAFLVLFARACVKLGKTKRGLDTVNKSIMLAEKTSELWYQAEAFRVKGELLIQQKSDTAEVEDCYLKARGIASQQQAKMFELRAAMSLFRLWEAQGKAEYGKQELVKLYDTFTEGFDMTDLVTAKKLIDTKDKTLVVN